MTFNLHLIQILESTCNGLVVEEGSISAAGCVEDLQIEIGVRHEELVVADPKALESFGFEFVFQDVVQGESLALASCPVIGRRHVDDGPDDAAEDGADDENGNQHPAPIFAARRRRHQLLNRMKTFKHFILLQNWLRNAAAEKDLVVLNLSREEFLKSGLVVILVGGFLAQFC